MIKYNNDIHAYSNFSTKCLHPRIIHSKDGSILKVPCGHCKSCYLSKSSLLSSMCTSHCSQYKYNLFVTLTYSPKYLPRFTIVRHESGYHLVGNCLRDTDNYGNIISSFNQSYLDDRGLTIDDIYMKHKGEQGYCCLSDYQKFLKRLRKSYDVLYRRVSGRKNICCPYRFTYFGCSEYGPVHFRPHFHFLISTNDYFIYLHFDSCIRKAWKFGELDWSLSRGFCQEYTAGYVNSFSFVPPYLLGKSCRPFSSHSVRYAWRAFQDIQCGIFQKNAAYLSSSASIRVVSSDYLPSYKVSTEKGSFTVRPSFRQLSSVFIKCRGYSRMSSRERTQSYMLYHYATTFFRNTSIIAIADTLSSYDIKDEVLCSNYYLRNIFEILRDDSSDDCCHHLLPVDTIRQCLYISSRVFHFIAAFIGDPHDYGSYIRYVTQVETFYAIYDYIRFSDFMLDCQIHSALYPEYYIYSPEYIYKNLATRSYLDIEGHEFFDYDGEDFFYHLQSHVDHVFNKAIKHRELNSLNSIYL